MKRIAAIITAAALFVSSASAFADIGTADLVTVSEWAYPMVSAFRENGLMPEELSTVTDYTQNITREQLCMLIYSVMEQCSTEITEAQSDPFTDTDNPKILALAEAGIVNGVSDTEFQPDGDITREAAAAIIYRAAQECEESLFEKDSSEETPELSDEDDISDWAKTEVKEIVKKGIMNGTGDGFDAQGNMSAEQAVITLYRLYIQLPKLKSAGTFDGVYSEIPDMDTEIKIHVYSNGCIESQIGQTLYITSTDGQKMAFGMDMYKTLDCVTRDGITYVFAASHDGKTYAYNLLTQEMLYELPCESVSELKTDWLIGKNHIENDDGTYSYVYGVFSYSGEEILPAEYTRTELRNMGYASSAGATAGGMSSSGGGVIRMHNSETDTYLTDTNSKEDTDTTDTTDTDTSETEYPTEDYIYRTYSKNGFKQVRNLKQALDFAGLTGTEAYIRFTADIDSTYKAKGIGYIGMCRPENLNGDGSYYIPLEEFAEIFGCGVKFSANTGIVELQISEEKKLVFDPSTPDTVTVNGTSETISHSLVQAKTSAVFSENVKRFTVLDVSDYRLWIEINDFAELIDYTVTLVNDENGNLDYADMIPKEGAQLPADIS